MNEYECSVIKQTNGSVNVEPTATKRSKAPNCIPALVLSGISFYLCIIAAIYAFCPFLSIVAIVIGIISLVLAVVGKNKTMQGYDIYYASPKSYFGVGMLKAAKIISLVSLIISIVSIVTAIIMTAVYSAIYNF